MIHNKVIMVYSYLGECAYKGSWFLIVWVRQLNLSLCHTMIALLFSITNITVLNCVLTGISFIHSYLKLHRVVYRISRTLENVLPISKFKLIFIAKRHNGTWLYLHFPVPGAQYMIGEKNTTQPAKTRASQGDVKYWRPTLAGINWDDKSQWQSEDYNTYRSTRQSWVQVHDLFDSTCGDPMLFKILPTIGGHSHIPLYANHFRKPPTTYWTNATQTFQEYPGQISTLREAISKVKSGPMVGHISSEYCNQIVGGNPRPLLFTGSSFNGFYS